MSRTGVRELSKNHVNHVIKRLLHPVLLMGTKLFDKCRLHIIGTNYIEQLTEPVIFVVNHSNGHDFPIAAQVINKHFYILADFTMKKDPIVNILNRLNGCVYVDRKDSRSRQQSKIELIGHLQQGHNILLFPEGTWNLHPSRLLLPLNWGVIDLAKETDAPIVPIALLYEDKCAYAKVGECFVPTQDKATEIIALEEKMATLVWDLISYIKPVCRSNLPEGYAETYVKLQLDTYRKLDLQYETSVIRSTSDTKYAFDHLSNITPTMQNAFLFNKRLK